VAILRNSELQGLQNSDDGEFRLTTAVKDALKATMLLKNILRFLKEVAILEPSTMDLFKASSAAL
jgi:hypothetical protein